MTKALNQLQDDPADVHEPDAASLTWQDAAKLVADGKAAFNIMGDWAERLLHGRGCKTEAEVGLRLGARCPGTDGVYQWLSDSFTLPKGAPQPRRGRDWLELSAASRAQDAFNPVKGSIPARQDANPRLYTDVSEWALKRVEDATSSPARSTHGVVANNAWNTDIDTALGLFLQNKDVPKFQSGLAAAAKKQRLGEEPVNGTRRSCDLTPTSPSTSNGTMRSIRRWGPGLLLVSAVDRPDRASSSTASSAGTSRSRSATGARRSRRSGLGRRWTHTRTCSADPSAGPTRVDHALVFTVVFIVGALLLG